MATAFKQLMQGKKKTSRTTVDCANGVGAPKSKRTYHASDTLFGDSNCQ